ncbi:CPBP family glutamic-type intramembrane protease [Streptomyces lydicus]|uniref:CPBP family glutamic-type intramembrane protease n=1 Tax=Streptomyces lydicus TaxID=47763 RepID=UPI000689B7BB|nr:CPBP family glutamic-type intramembrane protease [Streptomyces lydicus]UEG89166.1 CPBP family intramembrane metalloprotease [Streptomyces lydicus]
MATKEKRGTTEPGPAWRAWGRALLGGAVMAVALGTGNALGEALVRALDLDGYPAQLLPAALVSALAVPVVLALRTGRPGSGRPLGLGTPASAAHGFARGLAVTTACAALVLGGGTAAGWVRWSGPDPAALVSFLVGNALVAVLLEALPEETTLRGYAWASLRDRFGGLLSALGTTLVFLLVPAASTVVQAGVAQAVGVDAPPMGLAPAGQDPVAYPVLLSVFGLTLIAARTAPGRAPLWAAIGTHVAFLSVNRVVFEGGRRDAGWSAHVSPVHAAILELGYLAATAAVFTGARLLASRGRAPASGPRTAVSGPRVRAAAAWLRPVLPSGPRATASGGRRVQPSAATTYSVGVWAGGGSGLVPPVRVLSRASAPLPGAFSRGRPGAAVRRTPGTRRR